MAKKKHRRRRKKGIAFVCYIMVLAALLGALGYLYTVNKTKKAEHAAFKRVLMDAEAEEAVAELSAEETEEAKEVSPAPEPEEAPDPAADAEPSPPPAPVEEETFDPAVLVLNGTKIPGVAAYWKGELEKAGYTHVAVATYTKAVEAETVIYSGAEDGEEKSAAFRELFPSGVFRKEALQEGIVFGADQDVQQPSAFAYFIVIGTKDARNQ